ncbi:MAG: glycosyltransferase [Desulfovibrionaceae bacterium]
MTHSPDDPALAPLAPESDGSADAGPDPVPTWPKFRNERPRILLLTSRYFLMGEIEAACTRMGVDYRLLDLAGQEMELEAFVAAILSALDRFRPDFVLTVNHLGVDHEGFLAEVLARMDVPLASWFVDNPHLILPLYPPVRQERTVLFTWDADTVGSLRDMGYGLTFWLPLGADPERFHPGAETRPEWRARVAFVGNSMVHKVQKRLEAADPQGELGRRWREVAAEFGPSEEHSAARYLLTRHPELAADFRALASPARMLALETLLTWQSTLDYRLDCVRRLLPFRPLIAGDPGWPELLGPASESSSASDSGPGWRALAELNYYADLPAFYPGVDVNFNATSLQMKGAVNQRVFDVPACGAFLLTDRRRQMDELFEPGVEMAVYDDPDHIVPLVERYLADAPARTALAQAGRRRVLAEHTYDHRLARLIETMRQCFA